jgi:DNA-nicking Smr family endonuclease
MTDDVSDEDKALFRRMMSSVTPLAHSKKATIKSLPPKAKLPAKKTVIEPSRQYYDLSSHYYETVGTDSVLSFGKAHVQHKRWLLFKNGQIAWEGRLDLHGLRPDDAREALCRFLEQQTAMRHRCLLVIHGKGSRHGEAPILKNHVNHWLQQLPQVLAFHSALGKDGGTGALYVLLRRGEG